jgi:hypothetical protein
MICAAQGPTIEWLSVSTRQPCRVCGSTRGCRFQADGVFISCVNSESAWPLTNGGWLHRVDFAVSAREVVSVARRP